MIPHDYFPSASVHILRVLGQPTPSSLSLDQPLLKLDNLYLFLRENKQSFLLLYHGIQVQLHFVSHSSPSSTILIKGRGKDLAHLIPHPISFGFTSRQFRLPCLTLFPALLKLFRSVRHGCLGLDKLGLLVGDGLFQSPCFGSMFTLTRFSSRKSIN